MKNRKVTPLQAELFKRKWSPTKIARIAQLSTWGHSSLQIMKALGDGTSAASIRGNCRRWGIATKRGEKRSVMATMSHTDMAAVIRAAKKQGMSPAEWVGKVAGCAGRGDLYNAIVDEKGKR